MYVDFVMRMRDVIFYIGFDQSSRIQEDVRLIAETPEQKEVRLEVQRNRYRDRRTAETPEEWGARLEAQRNRYRDRHTAETPEERD